MTEIAAVILAAGRAARFGAGPDDSKVFALLEGMPLVAHVADAALRSSASRVLVVGGHAAARIEAALCGRTEIAVIYNPAFASGMASSIKAGIAALPGSVEGALILLADMPLVSSLTLDCLISDFSRERPDAVVPSFQGQWGNPVLIGRALFPELIELTGDRGARAMLTQGGRRIKICLVEDPHVLTDVDTPDALAKLAHH